MIEYIANEGPKLSNYSAGPLASNFCEPLKSRQMAQSKLLDWFHSLGQMPVAELYNYNCQKNNH